MSLTNLGAENMWRLLMASLALALVVSPADGHDPDGAWNWWFVLQRNMRGNSCCNGSDARFLSDDDWRISDKHYQVRIGGQWLDVEDWQLLKPAQSNPTGKAIIWYGDPEHELGFYIRCFTPSQES